MINATLSIDGAIIVVVLTFVLIFAVYCTRCWILRGMLITRADVGLHFAFAANCLEMGLCISAFILEKRVRRKYHTELEVEVFLVNKEFFVHYYSLYLVYVLELWSLKLAYLGYFFRLRHRFEKFNRRLYFFTCVYTAAGFIVTIIYAFARCRPFSKNWMLITEDVCITIKTVDFNAILAAMNLSNDLLILFLGLHIISSLVLGTRFKAALFTNAGLGFLSIVMGGVRFLCVYATILNPENGFVNQCHLVLGVSAFEITFGFTAFCLPSFRILWGRHQVSKGSGVALETIGGSRRSGITVRRTVDLIYEENGSQIELQGSRTTCV